MGRKLELRKWRVINQNNSNQSKVLKHRLMEAHFNYFIGALVLIVVQNCISLKLAEEFNWNTIEYEFTTAQSRESAMEMGLYEPGAAIPTGIEIWNDKMFIATPRINSGVPSTLSYIGIADVNTKSPRLIPYPSWDMNNNLNKSSKKNKMTSVYSIRADPCQRLWALDTGISEELTAKRVETPPTLFIFNLNDNSLQRKYTLQETEYDENSKFRSIVVDVTSGTCENAFAYIADTKNGLVVYSWYTNKSFRVTNNYFSFNPIWGNFKTSSGRDVQLSDGVIGLALSLPNSQGYRQLMFHPMIGTNEFRVSTEILQNKSLALHNITSFYHFGNRGLDSQSTASFLELEQGVLFYTTIVKNGISCWNSFKGEKLTPENQGNVDTFPNRNSFPYDLKVDRNGTLWVLTNSLLDLLYDKPSGNNVLFRVYSGKVKNIITGTPCEEI